MSRPPIAHALVGLSTLLCVGETFAETTVSGARAAPVVTSNANAGAADDVTIASGGSVTLTSGVGVTLDSDNAVANSGAIVIQDADDAVGIYVAGGHTGAVVNSGSIAVDETTTVADSDGDGDYDGPIATGSGRFGIRVAGGEVFTGSVVNSGSILVESASAVGVSIETALDGVLTNSGAVSATGDGAYGIRATGAVSGDVSISGSVSAVGEGAVGLSLAGPTGGGLVVQGAISATGYRTASRITDEDALAALDSDDLLQGGSALVVAADIARGILLDTAPDDTDDDVDDEDADGTDDASEGSASIAVYGGAPAMLIGSATQAISIGNVGTGETAYGLVVKGAIGGFGLYDGVSAVGLQVGIGGGGGVDLGGGISSSGSISAVAYEAQAVALRLNPGARAPALVNAGALTATVTAESAADAVALQVLEGAVLTRLINSGTLTASVSGEAGDATAVFDASGSLSSIVNTGKIAAAVSATDDSDDADDADLLASNEAVTGKAVALDLRANATGVTITQSGVADGDDGDDDVADDDEDADGVDDADEPYIVGDILLGSGDDRLSVLNGVIVGDLALGGGADSLHIDGGAEVAGDITTTGGDLALSIGSGVLTIGNTGTLALRSLALGAGSTLNLVVDPETGAYTALGVSGVATITQGASLGIRLSSLLQGSADYTLIRAASLTSTGLDAVLLGDVPYLYSAALVTDRSAATVTLSLDRKSGAELALPASIADAYEPMIAALNKDHDVRDALLAQTTRSGFTGVYNQILPDRSGAVAELVSAGAQAVARAIEDRQGPDAGGVWLQETSFAVIREEADDLPGYKAWSLGLLAGAEAPGLPLGILGATFALNSGKVENDDDVLGDSMVVNSAELGGYWRLVNGGLSAHARAGAAWVGVTNERAVAVYDGDDARILLRTASGKWSGAALSGKTSIGYEARFGRFYARPTASLDYLYLREGAYRERGGGDAVDLDVEARTTQRVDGFIGVITGVRFGEEAWWGPEVQAGWRQVAGSGGKTIGRFASGTDDFTLLADEVTGGGLVLRGAVKGEGEGGAFTVEGGAQMRDDIAVYDLRLSAHFRF